MVEARLIMPLSSSVIVARGQIARRLIFVENWLDLLSASVVFTIGLARGSQVFVEVKLIIAIPRSITLANGNARRFVKMNVCEDVSMKTLATGYTYRAP